MASKEVEDLVRKAWKSIIADPKSWDQRAWINADNEACRTTFCLGGWMMVHKGFRQQGDNDDPGIVYFVDAAGEFVDPDDIVRPWAADIHGSNMISDSIFDSEHDTLPKLRSAIEAAGIVLDPIPQRAETDWDVQFDKDIEFFVDLCVKAGDRLTVRQVRGDEILMGLLRTIRRNGRREGKAEIPANEGVLEAQSLLAIEQRHAAKLRADLETQRATTVEYIRQRDDALKALREENEDLKIKNASAPSTRVDHLQRALRDRTRQAREAGAAAREARLHVRNKEAEMAALREILEQAGASKAMQGMLDDANRQIEILKIRMSLIHNYSTWGGL